MSNYNLHQSPTTLSVALKLGLTQFEYEKIQHILGRLPNFTELSLYSAMWSEHCAYKNSLHWLKQLPKEGRYVLAKAGDENAGLIDIGDGLACVFKIESHNHPAAIEPYQGAATGVGGIHRDIFSMGARPIAQLNSLRFGDSILSKTRWLVRNVVKGIGDYGNALGIPTVGGEVYFDAAYNINPLVNAFSAGIVSTNKVVKATAYGAGNLVYIYGAATGKDGIHGAAFASKDITQNSIEELPAVQIGDPFQEKLLLEATLEIIETGCIIGLQDMGAAGIVCATAEMSAKGNHGMDIWLDKVPTRQDNMKPFEILLSESQERMLVIVQQDKAAIIEAIFNKWDIHYAHIGLVKREEQLNYFMHNTCVASVPPSSLVVGGEAPVYIRDYQAPQYYTSLQSFTIHELPLPENYQKIALHLLAHPNIVSRRWIYEQYDHMVGINNTNVNQPADAAVVRIRGTQKALAMTVDCNSRYVYADPARGTAIAIAEAARNIICSGGEPMAITNCLNFGNPYDPTAYWQFVQAIQGMKEACNYFETPVTGGNVSFYNQSDDGGAVLPTPTIGMVGLLEDIQQKMTLDFKQEDDLIYLIGEPRNCVACSEYLHSYCGIQASPAPWFDFEKELALHDIMKYLIKSQHIQSAHDVAEGGLFIALAESAMPNNLGFSISTDPVYRKDAYLFGESQSRIVVSLAQEKQEIFEKTLNETTVPYQPLGHVNDGTYIIDGLAYCTCKDAQKLYEGVLPKLFQGT